MAISAAVVVVGCLRSVLPVRVRIVTKWLLLAYKIPREPSASRVYVWRKMKQLGAVLLQDAVWVLPESARTREQFQWLAAEITELGGDATLWVSDLIYATDDQALRRQFEEPVVSAYREILSGLKRKRPDRAALAKQYQQTQALDFFQSSLGQQVRDKLLTAKDGSTKRKGSRTP
jgi:ChrB-like protein